MMNNMHFIHSDLLNRVPQSYEHQIEAENKISAMKELMEPKKLN